MGVCHWSHWVVKRTEISGHQGSSVILRTPAVVLFSYPRHPSRHASKIHVRTAIRPRALSRLVRQGLMTTTPSHSLAYVLAVSSAEQGVRRGEKWFISWCCIARHRIIVELCCLQFFLLTYFSLHLRVFDKTHYHSPLSLVEIQLGLKETGMEGIETQSEDNTSLQCDTAPILQGARGASVHLQRDGRGARQISCAAGTWIVLSCVCLLVVIVYSLSMLHLSNCC